MKETVEQKNRIKTIDVKIIAKIGILSATASLLMILDFPLFFAPSFYKLDFSEVIVLLGAFALGPVAGVLIEAMKILLNFFLNGTDTMGIGEISNLLIGCSFILPAAIIYKIRKTRKNAIIGIIAGIVSMAVIGALMNIYVLIPTYSAVYRIPVETIIKMGTKINPAITNLNQLILFATTPFNLLKGILSGLITMILYKKLSGLLHK